MVTLRDVSPSVQACVAALDRSSAAHCTAHGDPAACRAAHDAYDACLARVRHGGSGGGRRRGTHMRGVVLDHVLRGAADDDESGPGASWGQIIALTVVMTAVLVGGGAALPYNPRRGRGDCSGWKWGKSPGCGN